MVARQRKAGNLKFGNESKQFLARECSQKIKKSKLFAIEIFAANFICTLFYVIKRIFISFTAARLHPRRRPAVSIRSTASWRIQPLHQELHEIRNCAVGSGHDLLVQLHPNRVCIAIKKLPCDEATLLKCYEVQLFEWLILLHGSLIIPYYR